MSIPWNIFLLKEEVTVPEDALKEPNNPELRKGGIKDSIGLEGLVAVQQKPSARKTWIDFLSGLSEIPIAVVEQQSLYALLIVKAKKRYFAFAFGQGRHLLDMNKVVEDFGLKFVLNRLNVTRIRSIESKTLAEDPLLVIRQLGTSGELGTFELNKARDILQRIQAKPADPEFATTFAGRNSLQLVKEIPAKRLEAFCKDLLEGYQELTYKTAFGWVDSVRPVVDTRVRDALDEWLVQELRSKTHHATRIAAPTIVAEGSENLATFRFRKAQSTTTPRSEPEFSEYFLDISNPLSINLNALRRDELEALDEDDQRIDSWPVYQTLYVEREFEGNIYILTNGAWMRVDKSYSQDLETRLSAYIVSGSLPACDDSWDEERYNKEAAKALGASCLDRKLILPPGEATQIELCDIFLPKCQMIHVKNYHGSAPLSHLFAQGRVSGTLLKKNGTVVDMLEEKLKKAGQNLHSHVKKPWQPTSVTIHFGIISRPGFSLPSDLPIFAKTDLDGTIERLTDLGYKVKVEAIPRA
jgi:uncharacterized protein (TIGR04141 family)